MGSDSFDFIVIGGGSAGCVLANRLSADPANKVLLLEAGRRDLNPWIHIPVGYFKTMHHPATDWCYWTETDPGLNDRSIRWPRGKVLGGSSSINGLLYIRGQKEDYDNWEKAGNPGWSYAEMLPYFIKCEYQERGADDYHGQNGLLKVSDIRVRREVGEAFIRGAQEIGIPWNGDFNGATQAGVGYFQLTAWKGVRCSSATGYLKPVLRRSNLRVVTRALATRIIMEGKRASAVEYLQGDSKYVNRVGREVIISAGAINSPQILMLSGVGNSDHLRKLQIPVICNLPGVGENLHDHLQIRSIYRCSVKTLNDEIRNPFHKMMIGLQYLLFRTGPMSMAASQIGIFTASQPHIKRPDIQFHFQPLSADSPGKSVHDFSGLTSSVTQLRPTSRGYLRLKSADPQDYVAIHPNYLNTDDDQVTTVNAMKLSRRIVNSQAMSAYIEEEVLPGHQVQTDAELLDCARNVGETIYHPVGTCKMGPASDPMAVVDAELRVHGLAGLRVVDASIMPVITSGNTNAPTFAIAEKAADLILRN